MDNHNNVLPDDEIDFGSLWQKITGAIKLPFVLLSRYFLITGIFIMLGVAAAITFKMLVPKTYTSSFIIRPNDQSDKFHVRMLEDIRALLKQKDWHTLSIHLKIDSARIHSLANIEVYATSNKVFRDSVNYTEVVIETEDNTLFIPVQQALINYLEANPYFSKMKAVELSNIMEENPVITKDLAMLDSLKKLQISQYGKEKNVGSQGLVIGETGDPVAYYRMSTEQLNKRYRLNAQKAFLDNFQLVKACVEIRKPSWPPRLIIVLAFSVPAALILCVFFLLFYTRHKTH